MTKKWLPPFFYGVLFFILSPHLWNHFSSHFFTDAGDGLQNIWNLWWINKAIVSLGKLPWFTDYLHFPDGTSLMGHTLNPFNGFAGIFLQQFLSPVQTYNALVVFSFVMGGMTAFWLCRELTGSYAASLIGGAVFTFSNYHFMHADGHLQLVSLEWLPLFILWWILFCTSPDIRKGIMAALALFLVILCDYYYFFYCVITGVFFFLWTAWKRKDIFYLFRQANLRALFSFLIPAVLTSGVLVAALILQNARDPFLWGSHASRDYSMDLLSPFVYGPHWRFRDWVEPLWRPLCVTQNANESSVYLGFSVIALLIYVWKKRRTSQIPYFNFWCLLGAFFFIMSLGPNLHIGGREIGFFGHRIHCMGKEINILLLPYAFFWLAFPPLRLSGVPIRMMIMVQLVAAILVAGGFYALLKMRSRWKYGVIAAFLAVLIFEYLPAPIPLTKPEHPRYVEVLKNLPEGAVLDLASPSTWALYYQTVHEKKMAFGYISRIPASVQRRDALLIKFIMEGKWEQVAHDFHIVYVVKGSRIPDTDIPVTPNLPAGTLVPEISKETMVFNGDGISIYRF
jgi:hypothetical protein